ncbi:MAG TPA: FecR domain-containing protein, partial [Bryobacteraceae bacterium]|nr:FecR domain-containing protein [Bryobacteraceae bacterium]
VAETSGFVTVTRANGHSEPALLQTVLKPGDRLHTESGSQATLRLGDNKLRVTWDSSVELQDATEHGVEARLTQGSVAAEIHALGEGEVWSFDTPAGMVRLREVGNYRVDTDRARVWLRVTVQDGLAQMGKGGVFGLLHAGESGDLSAAGVIDVRRTIGREAFNAAAWVWPVPNARLHTLATHEANRAKAEEIVREANNPGLQDGPILAPTHELIVPSPIHTSPPFLGIPTIHP